MTEHQMTLARIQALEIFVLSLMIESMEDSTPRDKHQEMSFISSALIVFSKDAGIAADALLSGNSQDIQGELARLKSELKSISEGK